MFYPKKPRTGDICIEDIAHALAMQCRYNGHCKRFYSVGEHCLLVCSEVWKKTGDVEEALAALLHDASEAYICDIPRPFKPMIIGYKKFESTIERVIADKFHLEYPWSPTIKEIDDRILNDERKQLMCDTGNEWACNPEPLGITLLLYTPAMVERLFLKTYNELEKKRSCVIPRELLPARAGAIRS
jgi:hypothetical protein